MKHKIKNWAVNAALFIPALVGLIREAGILAINAGLVVALVYIGHRLFVPIVKQLKTRL